MTVVSNPRKRSRQVLIPKPVFALILVASNVLTYRCFLQRTSIPAAEETTAFVANTHNNDNKNNDQYSLARHHSYGFFQDIPNDEWQTHYREPTLASVHYHNQTHPNDQAHLVARWIFFNWDPFFSCPHLKKVGGLGDGPKYTCDPHRLGDTKNNNTNNGCLVYSIGSAGNYLFEDALLRLKPNCEIHVFDPGDYQRNETSSSTTTSASTSSKNVHFHQWGLTSDTYKVEARRGKGEYLTFVEMQRRLGHQDRTIDIFKIDCEGCEW